MALTEAFQQQKLSSMSESRREALVVLRHAETQSVSQLVRPYATVSQSISDRVAVVSVSDLAKLRSLPAIELLVSDSSTAPELVGLSDLSETESLFASAWLSRQSGHQKVRPGEGLDWDSPGFAPPDLTSEEDY